MAANKVSPSTLFSQQQSVAEVLCARCPNKTTDGPFCYECARLVRLELSYEQSLERRSDCGSLDGGEL